MGTVISIDGARRAPKSEQNRMDTIILTQQLVRTWQIPPFQRPLRINDKVRAVMESIKKAEAIEGVITLGQLADGEFFIVDGQHRAEAFKLSEIDAAIVDVRYIVFDTMAEMAQEFVRLNSNLVNMRPDDILRGLESSTPALKTIRKNCEFVGYAQIKRGTSAGPILSMSALLRCWSAANSETPTTSCSGLNAAGLAQSFDQTSVQNMVSFLAVAHSAWGRDPEYYRLWSNLNLALCMWLWNRLVIDRDRSGNKRYVVLTIPEFKKCLMSLSASSDHLNWLVGRNLSDRDRSPAYIRIKSIFTRRIAADAGGKKPMLPAPAWASK